MELLKEYLKDPYNKIGYFKLSDLTKLIKLADNIYYNQDNEIMTDQEYDFLKDELEKRKPNHKLLSKIGSKTHSKNKVKLPYHMGSMDKIKPGKELIQKWIKKYTGPYVYSDKLDGTSGLLVLPDNKLYTRGNGTIGTDISSIIKYIKGIPNYNKKYVVRGEFIISKKDFSKFKDKYCNSRAMINGLINKKKANVNELKYINFVAYELVYPEYNISKQFSDLKKNKFNVVFNKKIKKLNDDILSNILKDRKSNSNYDIDGIIVMDDNKHKRNSSGNPKYAFAFKDILEDQITKAEILKVEWRISKDRLLKPRVHLKPVKLCGITIKHVTGHNAKFIKNNGIGKGAIIKLIRSGDVIPYILDVIKKVKPEFPKISYKWNSTNVEIVLDDNSDISNKDLLVQNLLYFFKKMEIRNIDTKTIIKLVDNKLNSIDKILKASVVDFLKIDGFKDVLANKIHNNIHNQLKNIKLNILMAASNIFGSGLAEKKLLLIINKYPNILTLKNSNSELLDLILEIDGFSDKTANDFIKNLPKFKKFLLKLPKITIKRNQTKSNNKFDNFKIVFSGFRNKEWQQLIEDGGGKITTTVSKNTNILIVKDKSETSSKITKAKKLNIKIITIDQFKKLYL